MLKRLTTPFRDFFNTRFVGVANSFKALEADMDALRIQVDHLKVDEARFARSVSETVSRDVSETVRRDVSDTVTREVSDTVTRDVTSTVTKEVTSSLDTHHSDILGVAGLLGRSIDKSVDGLTEFMERTAKEINAGLAAHSAVALTFDREMQGDVAHLDNTLADIANYATSHQGWASQSGLWFNPAISVAHAAGGLHVANINERIAEIPFVFSSLGALSPGSRILDVGATESTVAISLASLGHQVTAVDPRPYPVEHKNLTIHIGAIETFKDKEPFDAVVLLSSIEHFGLGSYDLPLNENADVEAIRHVRGLVRPGGMLVITTPYGEAPTTALERTYSPEQLDALLEGWTVIERTYLTQVSPTEWHCVDQVDDLQDNNVVLVRATKPKD